MKFKKGDFVKVYIVSTNLKGVSQRKLYVVSQIISNNKFHYKIDGLDDVIVKGEKLQSKTINTNYFYEIESATEQELEKFNLLMEYKKNTEKLKELEINKQDLFFKSKNVINTILEAQKKMIEVLEKIIY